MNECILTMREIDKSFGSLQVLKRCQFSLYRGEVMALMGENGAGKSTLMKILSGIEKADQGEITLFQKPFTAKNIHDAEKNGIIVIHQELNLFDEMTVLDNIFLGDEILKNPLSIDYKLQQEELEMLFNQLKLNISSKQLVKELSIGQKQLVEIAKALRKNAKILIMDEPTSALSEDEISAIFEVIKEIRSRGVAVVYISHRMQEIYQICDRVTIMRDGEFVSEQKLSEISENELITQMIGREISDPFPYLAVKEQGDCLKVENLESEYVKDVNFTLKKGEILGIGGLMGSGRTSLAHCLFGLTPIHHGTITLNKQILKLRSPKDALKHQIVYISEDRKGDGLFVNFSIRDNISMPSLDLMSNKYGQINLKKEIDFVDTFANLTHVKAQNYKIPVSSLSGGNQQKVAISRALLIAPTVLILDEPTRGIDIGARREIYTLINKFKEKGTAIILISSDMPELLALSDRVLVMSEGKMTGILSYEEKSPENVMKLAINL